jgi:hypothetical protein
VVVKAPPSIRVLRCAGEAAGSGVESRMTPSPRGASRVGDAVRGGEREVCHGERSGGSLDRGAVGLLAGRAAACRLRAGAAGAGGVVGAVAGRAFPAGGVGEAPGLVGSEALVVGGDLAGGLGDAYERSAQLPGAAAGGDEARGHLLAPFAGFADLREAELAGGVVLQPAAGEVEAGLRVVVGLVLKTACGP